MNAERISCYAGDHIVDQGSLVSTLLTLRDGARSGVLEVRSDGVRTFLYLLEGQLVFAEEESTGETLGRLMVRQNKLTQAQYVAVIDRMTDDLIGNEQLRFGEVAVELGFLSAEEVESALSDQVRWKIIRALQREEHEFTFSDSSGDLEGVVRSPLALEPLILEAYRWVTEERKQFTLALVAPDRLLTLRESANAVAKRYQTTPDERAFLDQLDGRKCMPELLGLAETSETDVPALLTALVLSRGIAYAKPDPKSVAPVPSPPPGAAEPTQPTRDVSPPKPQPAPGRDATAGTAVHRGYVPTPQQFIPFRGPAPDTTKEKDAAKEKADRALALLRNIRTAARPAGESSGQSVAREVPKAPSDHEARLVAEQAFQRGRKQLYQGQFKQAHTELEKARALQPASIEYELHALWAAFVIGTAKPDESRAKLKVVSAAALKNDPNSAFSYYVMGEIALHEKNETTARRAFAHAVKLDPQLLDAQRRLRLLGNKK